MLSSCSVSVVGSCFPASCAFCPRCVVVDNRPGDAEHRKRAPDLVVVVVGSPVSSSRITGSTVSLLATGEMMVWCFKLLHNLFADHPRCTRSLLGFVRNATLGKGKTCKNYNKAKIEISIPLPGPAWCLVIFCFCQRDRELTSPVSVVVTAKELCRFSSPNRCNQRAPEIGGILGRL